MKKPLILSMTTMLALSTLSMNLAPSAYASENSVNQIEETTASEREVSDKKILFRENVAKLLEEREMVRQVDAGIAAVEPYVLTDANGMFYIDKNIPTDVYEKYNVQDLEKEFAEINLQVKNNEVEINDDLSITSNQVETLAKKKGYTSKRFWWGERATYTNTQAKNAISQLNSAAINIGFGGALTFWLPLASVPAGITAYYCHKLGDSMSRANKGRGVILDMTWALTYKTKSR